MIPWQEREIVVVLAKAAPIDRIALDFAGIIVGQDERSAMTA